MVSRQAEQRRPDKSKTTTLNEPIPNDQTESVLRPRCRQLKRVRRRPSESRRERSLTTARRPANGTRLRMRPSTRRCVTNYYLIQSNKLRIYRNARLSSGIDGCGDWRYCAIKLSGLRPDLNRSMEIRQRHNWIAETISVEFGDKNSC